MVMVLPRAGPGGGQLRADKYLLPYASVELALLLLDTTDTQHTRDEAWSLLETAKSYKVCKYFLIYLFFFRLKIFFKMYFRTTACRADSTSGSTLPSTS